jgi:6-phosphogluconate dehydrogenase
MVEAAAARWDGEPCAAYLGPASSAHFVQRVHDGIESALLQLLAESYDLMKRGLGLSNDELADVFAGWAQRDAGSFLVATAATVFRQADDRDPSARLIDRIKGKGPATGIDHEARGLGVPLPAVDAAEALRDLVNREAERAEAHRLYGGPSAALGADPTAFLGRLENALYAATAIAFTQGLDLLQRASTEHRLTLRLEEIARVWRGGGTIRAALLGDVRAAYRSRADLPHLLLDPKLATQMQARLADLRAVVGAAVTAGLPAAALSASLAYLDALRSGWLPANLIQAQRDVIGAHTYERTDAAGTFHTEWGRRPESAS